MSRARECMLEGFCVCVCVRACIYVCVFVSVRAYVRFDVILKLHVIKLHEPVLLIGKTNSLVLSPAHRRRGCISNKQVTSLYLRLF